MTKLFDTTVAPPLALSQVSLGATAPTEDQWLAYINAPESNPVLAIIERGKRIGEYRATCDKRGDRSNTFEAFCCNRLKISKVTAYMLISISEWAQNRITVFYDSLPASWRTLYDLSRLPAPIFDAALAAGKINPEMTRAEAGALKSPQAIPAIQPPALAIPAPTIVWRIRLPRQLHLRLRRPPSASDTVTLPASLFKYMQDEIIRLNVALALATR